MRKWWLLFAGLMLWSFLGYALFGGTSVPSDTQTLPRAQVARIVSMGPNLTEILYALGLGPSIVGVTDDSDYPPEVNAVPRVGSFWQPNIEAIIATKPDLVVTLGFEQQRELAYRLRRMDYDTLALDIDRIEGFYQSVGEIAEATGTEDRAQELTNGLRGHIQTLHARVAAYAKVKALWVVQREPLRVAGLDTFPNELLELAGGLNAVGPTLQKYPPIGAEQIIASGIEVIIEPTMIPGDEDKQHEQALQYWARFPNVPAVANGRIYIVDGDLVSRLGPRLYEGVETIARCLRPELFGE